MLPVVYSSLSKSLSKSLYLGQPRAPGAPSSSAILPDQDYYTKTYNERLDHWTVILHAEYKHQCQSQSQQVHNTIKAIFTHSPILLCNIDIPHLMSSQAVSTAPLVQGPSSHAVQPLLPSLLTSHDVSQEQL